MKSSEPAGIGDQPETAPPAAKSAKASRSTAGPLRIRKILVPLDFSQCSTHALDYALGMAEAFGASVILLHIVEPAAVSSENYLNVTPMLDESHQQLLEAGRERLADLSQKHMGHKIPTESLVRIGRAPSEIADTAEALGVDLIVMGTHGYSGIKHALLGSTAEKVVRHAVCPVLTVRHPGE